MRVQVVNLRSRGLARELWERDRGPILARVAPRPCPVESVAQLKMPRRRPTKRGGTGMTNSPASPCETPKPCSGPRASALSAGRSSVPATSRFSSPPVRPPHRQPVGSGYAFSYRVSTGVCVGVIAGRRAAEVRQSPAGRRPREGFATRLRRASAATPPEHKLRTRQ